MRHKERVYGSAAKVEAKGMREREGMRGRKSGVEREAQGPHKDGEALVVKDKFNL